MFEIKNEFKIDKISEYYHYIHKNDYVFYGHRHYDAEINIILSGVIEIACGDGAFCVEEGNMVLIPPETFHQNRVTGNKNVEMVVVHFEICDMPFLEKTAVFAMNEDIGKLVKIFCKDMEQNTTPKADDCFFINDSAKKLFEIILQYASVNKICLHDKESETTSIYNSAVKFMQENICDKLLVSDIAKNCGVCTTTLKNVFSYYTGRGCITYFNELKIEKAKEMLNSGKSCGYVSSVLGFSSQAYFSKRFKQIYGIAPSKVKR